MLNIHVMEPICHSGWSDSVGDWLDWLSAGGAARGTVDLRRYQLGRVAAAHHGISPWAITPDDLARWLAGRGWDRETLRSMRSALRSFYGWAHASGRIDNDPARLLRRVPATVGRPRPARDDTIEAALAGAPTRVRHMILLGSCYGLRRCEIAAVNRRDLQVDGAHWSLLVRGKGGKLRTLPLMPDMAAIIRDCDDPAGWLFPNGFGSHLTPHHLGRLVKRALGPDATCHMLRHRFGTAAYRAHRDIRAVQILLGHASPVTTQVYTAPADDALRLTTAAAQLRAS